MQHVIQVRIEPVQRAADVALAQWFLGASAAMRWFRLPGDTERKWCVSLAEMGAATCPEAWAEFELTGVVHRLTAADILGEGVPELPPEHAETLRRLLSRG